MDKGTQQCGTHGTVNPSLQARVPARDPAICGLDSRYLQPAAPPVAYSTTNLSISLKPHTTGTRILRFDCLLLIKTSYGHAPRSFLRVTATKATRQLRGTVYSYGPPSGTLTNYASRTINLGIDLDLAWCYLFYGEDPAILSTESILRWRLTKDLENEPRDPGKQPTPTSHKLHDGWSCVSVGRAR